MSTSGQTKISSCLQCNIRELVYPSQTEWMNEQIEQMNAVKWKGKNSRCKKISSPPKRMQVVCLSVGRNWITFYRKMESWPNFHSQYTTKVILLGWWPDPKGPTTRSLFWQKYISRDHVFFVSFCAMRLLHTILETFEQALEQSRAGFLNFGLQPEIEPMLGPLGLGS